MNHSALSLFGSQVGRRIFALMALSGLLPLILTLILSQVAARQELQQSLQVQLRDDAKAYGMGILSVLQQRTNEARQLARRLARPGAGTILDDASQHFAAVWRLSENGEHQPLLGTDPLLLPWPRLNLTHLSNGQSQLIRTFSVSGQQQWILVVPTETGSRRFLLALRLKEESLWKPYNYLPPHALYCVFSGSNQLIYCTNPLDNASTAALSDRLNGSGDITIKWTRDDNDMLAVGWHLFLGAGFAADDLQVIAAIDTARAFGSLNEFQKLLPPLVAAVVIMIVLLSVRLMRKNLVPLKNLTLATQEYADGNLQTLIPVDSKDEFGQLGTAFNKMVCRLDQQFDVLRAMSGVDEQVMAGENIDQVCKHFLREINQLFSLQSAGICIADRENAGVAQLLVRLNKQLFRRRIGLDQPFDSAEASNDSQFDADTEIHLDPVIKSAFQAHGASNIVHFPIRTNGKVRGVVLLSIHDGDTFYDDARDLCLKLISRLAMGIASIEREKTLHRKSNYDDLTQLPNRQLLKERLAQSLKNLKNSEERGALLFVDLDRFKEVNDVFGHSVGDTLLTEAARRMQLICDHDFTVARLGGDEFVVLMPEIDNHSQVRAIARALIDALSQPFDVAGREQVLGASVGISIFPDDGKSVEITLRNADAAMYRAKASGRGRFEFYSEEMNAASQRRLLMERELRNAVKFKELQLFVQPQVDLRTGALRGAECLLRWHHKKLGWISPAEFIPIAEESGLIVQIGAWTIDHACQQWRTMLDDGLNPGVFSINVSGRELEESDYAAQIIQALDRHELDPGALEVEITESIVARDKELAVRTLTLLRNLGSSVAMDDFGTGYSSLSFLRHLPLDCIKVDQSFVSVIGTSSDAESLCRTIISMAHELGKFVVAEGIESSRHADFLNDLGCEFGQGYHVAKPMPMNEFRAFVTELQAQPERKRVIA